MHIDILVIILAHTYIPYRSDCDASFFYPMRELRIQAAQTCWPTSNHIQLICGRSSNVSKHKYIDFTV